MLPALAIAGRSAGPSALGVAWNAQSRLLTIGGQSLRGRATAAAPAQDLHHAPAAPAPPAGAATQAPAPAGAGLPPPRHPSAAAPQPTGYMGFAASGAFQRLPGAVDFHTVPSDVSAAMTNPTYDPDYLASVQPRHLRPERGYQKVAFKAINTVRAVFDKVTGYTENGMTEAQWLRRMIFLETIAGVPGMVAGMLRHLKSLRKMERDNGWINTLLQEAENERMHLLTFLTLRDPGIMFRTMVILAQGVFFNAYFLAYLVSPRTCHAMVGYLEEEAVKTYTHALRDIDAGKLWPNTPAIAIDYWRLPKDATMKDIILAIRADEACHSHVNHTFSNIRQTAPNPFHQGSHHIA